MRALLLLLLLAALPACAQSVNPDVTQENIQQTICVHGWTKTVRPSTGYTYAVKRRLMEEQGIPLEKIASFELDHAIPLSSGGHPTDPANLKLQPWDGPDGARAKDRIESSLHRAVCAGRVSLADARECMARDWHACEGLLLPTTAP